MGYILLVIGLQEQPDTESLSSSLRDSKNSLVNLYYTNFAFMQHHKYSLTELENMFPFEREIYLQMLIQHLKDEEERLKKKR